MAFAFRMYRNYNGIGGKFGDTTVKAVSNFQSKLSVYAAEETDTGALTVMVINKTANNLTAPLTLSHFTPIGTVQRWQYSATQLGQIVHLLDQTLAGNKINSTFPANSITLYRIPGHHL
jgi:peptidoglycan hydrolase-like protein with peptidoglycan-binding domain